MKNGKIGIGIIGAGNIAQSAHLPSYAQHNDCEVVSVYDIKEGRGASAAAKFGITRVADSLDELLADPDVDAVSVCTWNNGHKDAAVAALKAGKHVLCEKPMTVSVADAEIMGKAADASGKVFLMGFVNRFKNGTKVLKEMAEEGKFGEFYYARASHLRRRGTPLGWFTDPAKSGGGPVIDIGVHMLDVAWYLLGKPEPLSVSATVHKFLGDYKTKGVSRWEAYDTDNLIFDVEDSAAGMIRFKNGCSLNFDVSWAINAPRTAMEVHLYGTKAGCSLDPLETYGEDGGYLTDNKPVLSGGNGLDMGFFNETRHFLDCIQGKCKPIAPASDGVAVQKILNGIYDSALAGKEILI
jgi:predicted dehydrogenase